MVPNAEEHLAAALKRASRVTPSTKLKNEAAKARNKASRSMDGERSLLCSHFSMAGMQPHLSWHQSSEHSESVPGSGTVIPHPKALGSRNKQSADWDAASFCDGSMLQGNNR